MAWEEVLKNQNVLAARQMLLEAIVKRYNLDAMEQQFVQAQGLTPDNLYQGLVDFINSGSTLEQAISEERLAMQMNMESGRKPGGLTMEQYQKDLAAGRFGQPGPTQNQQQVPR